jgi:hypothetical protein
VIKVVTNNLGSGDWILVSDNLGELWSGHSIRAHELANILALAGLEVELVEVNDKQMNKASTKNG